MGGYSCFECPLVDTEREPKANVLGLEAWLRDQQRRDLARHRSYVNLDGGLRTKAYVVWISLWAARALILLWSFLLGYFVGSIANRL